ncbi:MAG TPA: hypothetical protein VIS78_03345 [Blastocatellia bacterium]
MNHNLEEQKIKQWFHEARQADAARAPAFADVLAAAAQSKRRGAARWLAWRIAFVSVVLLTIGIAAFVFFKESRTEPPDAAGVARLPLYPQNPLAPTTPRAVTHRPDRSAKATPANIRLSARSRRLAQPRFAVGPSALLSFKWQSPTDFLLQTPGADLLKTVPRVGDSLIRFDVIRRDTEN